MRNILKFEFFFSPRALFSDEVKKALNFFAPGWNWEGGTNEDWIRGFGQYFKDWDELSVYSGLLGELLESYAILMNFVKENPGEAMDKKQLNSKLVKFGMDLNSEGKLSYPESISVQNFSNGLLSCENRKYLTTEKLEDQTLLKIAAWNFETEQMLNNIEKFLALLVERPAVLVGEY